MTSTEMPSRLVMPRPFAENNSSTIGLSSTSNDLNFIDGFNSKYALPSANGGKYVTRKDMNAIGNLASNDLFYKKAGGLNTFDIAFAHYIGGYPKGAVLDILISNQLYKVASLIDNNKYNPEGVSGSGDFSDILAGSVDDINWMYINTEKAKQTNEVFFEGGYGLSPGNTILALVECKKTGTIGVENSITASASDTYSSDTTSGNIAIRMFYGCSIAINDFGTTKPTSILTPTWTGSGSSSDVNWQGWQNISGNFQAFLAYSTTWNSADLSSVRSFNMNVVSGNYYALALLCGWAKREVISSTAYVTVRSYDTKSVTGSVRLTYQ